MKRIIGFIYLFSADPFLFKIGVSNHPRKRRRQVSHDVTPVRIIFVIPTFAPYFFEKFLHFMFKYSRTKMYGNGGTEFFKDILFVQQLAAILVMLFIATIQAVAIIYFI